MNPKLLKTVAVVMLALAMAALGRAFFVSHKRVNIQGPSALAVLADRSVWLSVEDALWHLDPDGKRIANVDAQTLGRGGLSGLIGNLVVHPSGQLVASVRDDATLYFLDATHGAITSRMTPQWPAELREHGSRAITYAFHDDGRVAISTGGGHAVAVFDAQGRFLARTPPGTYEFTNGLWWTADSLWTTNTNGQALIELDAHTLAQKSQVRLFSSQSGWRYLGMAAASHGKPSPLGATGSAGQQAPLATVVRFANGMLVGHATDVFRNGAQGNYPVAALQEPRDIKWRDTELLLVDGASYAIKRYSDSRLPLADFGEPQVRAELSALLAQRESLQTQYHVGLAGAVALFLIGFVAALKAQQLEKRQSLAGLAVDLSQVGTPRLSKTQWLWAVLKMYWAPLAFMVAVALASPTLRLFPAVAKTYALPMLLGKMVLVTLALCLFVRAFRRGGADPALEGLANFQAMSFLESDLSFWRLLHAGELPRETLMMMGSRRGLHWLVLTNQRLLVFVSNLKERTLLVDYPRRTIVGLRLLAPQDLSWWQRVQRFLNLGAAVLRFEFKDGTTLQGTTTATATARRMAALLQASAFDAPTISQMGQALRDQARPRAAVPAIQIAIRQTLASLLVPGLGQWMQGRSGTALRFFLAWSVMLVFSAIPVIWVLWAPRAAVSFGSTAYVAMIYGLTCLVAALDAWRMRARRVQVQVLGQL
jgi:hypothetical protein